MIKYVLKPTASNPTNDFLNSNVSNLVTRRYELVIISSSRMG